MEERERKPEELTQTMAALAIPVKGLLGYTLHLVYRVGTQV